MDDTPHAIRVCADCTDDLADCPEIYTATSTRPLNVPLLMKVLQQIREEAEKPPRESLWDQGHFFYQFQHCRTSACFAGWTIMLAGHEVGFSPSGQFVSIGDNSHASPADLAQEELGLSAQEANHLFFHTRTRLTEIEEFISQILESRGLTPALPELTVPATPEPVPVSAP
jgi:hypothetical protein